MSDTNEKEWWISLGRQADSDDLNRWMADPDAVEAIIAESERRKVKEIREEIEKERTSLSNSESSEFQVVQEIVWNAALYVVLNLPCLKDEI